jgi:hypothetical protein
MLLGSCTDRVDDLNSVDLGHSETSAPLPGLVGPVSLALCVLLPESGRGPLQRTLSEHITFLEQKLDAFTTASEAGKSAFAAERDNNRSRDRGKNIGAFSEGLRFRSEAQEVEKVTGSFRTG